MTDTTDDGDGNGKNTDGNGHGGANVHQFPPTPQEREALRKAKQDLARQQLVNSFIANDAGLFHTSDGTVYADLILRGHRETWPVRSKQFRAEYVRYLKRKVDPAMAEGGDALFALVLARALKKTAINAAIDEFENEAVASAVEREVHVRVAAHGDDIYIDLCDADWHVVLITALGWSIVQDPPVRFRRTRGMLPLPFPERRRGVTVDALRPLINARDHDFTLAVAWLLAALRPVGPYPVLTPIGEHGTAKTWFMRVLRSLSDPSVVATSSLPRSGRDLFIAAHNSRVQAFENVSKLSNAMSDALCRLATGSGMRTRALFTDSDEVLLKAVRPVMLEGISNFITRTDLLDRAIILALEPLDDRKTERELLAELERVRPAIFAALLDMLVQGIRTLPDVCLTMPLPRMADFAICSVASGLDGFEKAYAANRQAAIDTLLEHDLLARAVRALMAKRTTWAGTATALLDVLGPTAVKIANARTLSDELNRLSQMLRTVGIDVRRNRSNVERQITITRRRR